MANPSMSNVTTHLNRKVSRVPTYLCGNSRNVTMPQGSAKSPQATGEPDLSTSLQSDSYLFYEMKFYLLCASLIKEINVTGMQSDRYAKIRLMGERT